MMASSRRILPWLAGISVLLPIAAATGSICSTLAAELSGRVYMPNSVGYNNSQSDYYSAQERELAPSCVVRPSDTADVSRFMRLINHGNDSCSAQKFAVRSGGHTLFSGAANIQGGVTLDMRSINQVVISDDRQVVRTGGGSVFSDVYPQLVPHNLTVMGGRMPGIAAGGFVTGGECAYAPCSPAGGFGK